MEHLDLKISGMSCGHCVASVTSALEKLEGVKVDAVAVGSASVSFDTATTNPQEIRNAIEAAGFEAA